LLVGSTHEQVMKMSLDGPHPFFQLGRRQVPLREAMLIMKHQLGAFEERLAESARPIETPRRTGSCPSVADDPLAKSYASRYFMREVEQWRVQAHYTSGSKRCPRTGGTCSHVRKPRM
jgi:hypothetical protein